MVIGEHLEGAVVESRRAEEVAVPLFQTREGFGCLGGEDVVREVGEGGEGFRLEVVGGRGEEESFGDRRGGRLPWGRLCAAIEGVRTERFSR